MFPAVADIIHAQHNRKGNIYCNIQPEAMNIFIALQYIFPIMIVFRLKL
jgi:hypothetical protein